MKEPDLRPGYVYPTYYAIPYYARDRWFARVAAWIKDVEASLAPCTVSIYGQDVTLEAVELVHGQHYGHMKLRRGRVK